MPNITALVINVKPQSKPQGAAGQWQDLTAGIQSFTRDIITPTIQEGVDVSAIVSGVPSAFARADLFDHALNEIQTIRKNASDGLNQYYVNLVDEWRGLIACIALNNTAIEVKRIDLAYSDGKDIRTTANIYEPKGAFGNMLMNDRRLWMDQAAAKNDQAKPFLYVIKYNGQVVGATSPRSLFFTSVAYSINKTAVFVDPQTHRFTDPLHSTIPDEQLLNLYAYVDKLLSRIPKLEDYYKQAGLTYQGLKGELVTWRDEILSLVRSRGLDENNASTLPVQGFGAPFTFLNYTEALYGHDGVISVESDGSKDAKMFKPEELLLPNTSKLARIWLPREYEKGEKDFKVLPVYLLRARKLGSSDYAFFAIPLSQIGLLVFGRNVSSLLGYVQMGVGINSQMSAEFDEEKSVLSVKLTISVADENGAKKAKTIPIDYNISGIFARNKDVVVWPNFISDKWNRYFMYSEMPHDARQNDCPYCAVPFAGDNNGNIIVDNEGNIQFLANKGVAAEGAKLLVMSDSRTAASNYKYEIYESAKPFKGVRLTHISGSDSGYVLINYSSNLNANDGLPKSYLGVNRQLTGVTVGVDFGSTNTSVAYHNDNMTNAEGLQLSSQRFSLFTDLCSNNANQIPAERYVLFFQNEEIYSNAIKSILAVHDDQRLPNAANTNINILCGEAVQGGFPCFSRQLPISNVADDEIMLSFRGGQNMVKLIHNMKWSDRDIDKAHKQAFLSSLLLHIYAELFVKNLVPTDLRWSYPSAMGYELIKKYDEIWNSLNRVSPVIDNKTQMQVQLNVSDASIDNVSKDNNFFDFFGDDSDSIESDGLMLDGGVFGSIMTGSNHPVGENSNTETSSELCGFGAPLSSSIGTDESMSGQNGLRVDRSSFKFNFKPIDTTKAMTEACAVANYISATIKDGNELTFCLDVGGSTTDVSVISQDQVGYKMLKQNSIRFAAQRIANATRYMETPFKRVLEEVCYNNKLELIGFNKGESLYSAETAPYYFEQVVDRLDKPQLEAFYKILQSKCPALVCVDLYVTGLITYYVGQLAIKLVKEVRRSTELKLAIDNQTNWRPRIIIRFAGKGARIFEWLNAIEEKLAKQYYVTLLCIGMGGPTVYRDYFSGAPRIDIHTNEANEVKFEVSKGLAKTPSGKLMVSDNVIEIVGENGFTLYNSDTQKSEELTFEDSILPDFIKSIGVNFNSAANFDASKLCFCQFAKIFATCITTLFGKDIVDATVIANGIRSMAGINTYIKNLPEVQKAFRKGQGEFDYVAPIIILEGMKFYDEYLMKMFKLDK